MKPANKQCRDPSVQLAMRKRVDVHWVANLRMLRRGSAVAGFVAISLVPIPLLVAAVFLMPGIWWSPRGDPGPMAAVSLAMVALYTLLQYRAFLRAIESHYNPFVVAALWERGQPVCARCGQLLGPCAPAACPECGSECRAPR